MRPRQTGPLCWTRWVAPTTSTQTWASSRAVTWRWWCQPQVGNHSITASTAADTARSAFCWLAAGDHHTHEYLRCLLQPHGRGCGDGCSTMPQTLLDNQHVCLFFQTFQCHRLLLVHECSLHHVPSPWECGSQEDSCAVTGRQAASRQVTQALSGAVVIYRSVLLTFSLTASQHGCIPYACSA